MNRTELYNAIINGTEITDEMRECATELKSKNDSANARKAQKLAEKKTTVDTPIKNALVDHIKSNATDTDNVFVVSNLYEDVDFGEDDISKSKISAMCNSLVADGILTVCDVKVKGGRTVKGYSLA